MVAQPITAKRATNRVNSAAIHECGPPGAAGSQNRAGVQACTGGRDAARESELYSTFQPSPLSPQRAILTKRACKHMANDEDCRLIVPLC